MAAANPNPAPKPLRDIRYFESTLPPAPGTAMPPYTGTLFQLPKSATALGQRIAMKCEELGLSIGRADHLYLCFTPALAEGEFARTDYSVESWHRYALHGLPAGFNALADEEKFARVREATFRALENLAFELAAERAAGSASGPAPHPASEHAPGPASATAPEHVRALATIRAGIDAHGEALRIVLKRKQTKHYAIRVEQTVPVHPQPAPVFVIVTDLASGVTKEAKVAEVTFYDEAPSLIDRIAIVGGMLVIHPRRSFRASLVTRPYKVPIEADLAEMMRG